MPTDNEYQAETSLKVATKYTAQLVISDLRFLGIVCCHASSILFLVALRICGSKRTGYLDQKVVQTGQTMTNKSAHLSTKYSHVPKTICNNPAYHPRRCTAHSYECSSPDMACSKQGAVGKVKLTYVVGVLEKTNQHTFNQHDKWQMPSFGISSSGFLLVVLQ